LVHDVRKIDNNPVFATQMLKMLIGNLYLKREFICWSCGTPRNLRLALSVKKPAPLTISPVTPMAWASGVEKIPTTQTPFLFKVSSISLFDVSVQQWPQQQCRNIPKYYTLYREQMALKYPTTPTEQLQGVVKERRRKKNPLRRLIFLIRPNFTSPSSIIPNMTN
jgi:hypothetical protein